MIIIIILMEKESQLNFINNKIDENILLQSINENKSNIIIEISPCKINKLKNLKQNLILGHKPNENQLIPNNGILSFLDNNELIKLTKTSKLLNKLAQSVLYDRQIYKIVNLGNLFGSKRAEFDRNIIKKRVTTNCET